MLKIDNKYSYAEDIGMICLAHGENYEYIKSKLRKSVTKGQYEYNQQYIAVLLRIADYLDLDRQRTPMLWFSAMGISGFSKSKWEEHFLISNEKKLKPYYDGKMQIYFDGKSSNAKIHRKYLKYIDNLRDELENADALLNNKDTIQKYKLNITTKIDNLVITDGFQYSDLRLNLDYAAITELLMGKNIYGDNRLGLRELIQNSIDACKIMKEVGNNIIGAPEPSISIILSKKHNYVVIKDSGIGMTLDIVKNHFLNIGKSYYKSNTFLYNNYNYSPIGQYGIGFLACFLLSDNVIVKTKHYKSNEIYQIELEKNSEYVVTNTQQATMFYGTEIQLDYKRFFTIFKSMEELKEFVGSYFFTDIPIDIIDLDANDKIVINNTQSEEVDRIISNNKKLKLEIIDASLYSQCLKGKIILCPNKGQKASIVDMKVDKSYLYDGQKEIFKKTTKIPDGYYYMMPYAILSEEDYQNITKTKKEPDRKSKEILSLAQQNDSDIYLFVKQKDSFPFFGYVNELDDDNKTSEILSNSKLDYYPEMFNYSNKSLIFKKEEELLYLHIRAFHHNYYRFRYFSPLDDHPVSLYYKDIMVRDFKPLSIALHLPYQIFGFINYYGKDLRLDVSRNEVIDGSDFLQQEFENIIIKGRIAQETNTQIQKFYEQMAIHNGLRSK